MPFATRFAPSPTGYLHLGHAFSALTAWEAAQTAGGRFVLRIEDIDTGRCRPEVEAAIFGDLAWLGLDWETPVRRQSEHLSTYAAALDSLIARGLVYRCFRTRKELGEALSAPHGPVEAFRGDPMPEMEEREKLEAGAPYAWRLSLAACEAALGARYTRLTFEADGRTVQAEPHRLGDVVLARKDTPTSYHLASVLDDAAAGITHVIRGEDLAEAAHLHVLLQALFDLPTPIYRHHRLILGADGKRLAKRDAAATLRAMRAAGENPQNIRTRVGL